MALSDDSFDTDYVFEFFKSDSMFAMPRDSAGRQAILDAMKLNQKTIGTASLFEMSQKAHFVLVFASDAWTL